MSTPLSLRQQIQQDAAQCVKCGLCLPHCPTYQVANHEAESPRGRIALMAGIASQQIHTTPALLQHLDHCLSCRACESVCPAHVPYGQLIDNARTLLAQQGHRTLPRWIDILLTKPKKLRRYLSLIYWYQKLGLQRFIRASHCLKLFPRLQKIEALFSTVSRPRRWALQYSPVNKTEHSAKGHVALFTGCITPTIEADVIDKAIQLLTACGYGVKLPPEQTCCGGLHRHAGEKDTAERLLQSNISAFIENDFDAILSLASGCGATLKEYARYAENAVAFSAKVQDIHSFLNQYSWRFKPLAEHILLHIPCTLRQVPGQVSALLSLLQQIPSIKLQVLNSGGCCGAAGTQMLSEPQQADALLQALLTPLQNLPTVTRVLTLNTACRMHIATVLDKQYPHVLLQHPLELLAELQQHNSC